MIWWWWGYWRWWRIVLETQGLPLSWESALSEPTPGNMKKANSNVTILFRDNENLNLLFGAPYFYWLWAWSHCRSGCPEKEAVFAILAIVNIYANWRAAKYQEGENGALTWLWSVENGGKYCREWRLKNSARNITGEGRRVFATLTCWVGTGGEEIWSETCARGEASRKPQSRVIVTSIQSFLSNWPTSPTSPHENIVQTWRHCQTKKVLDNSSTFRRDPPHLHTRVKERVLPRRMIPELLAFSLKSVFHELQELYLLMTSGVWVLLLFLWQYNPARLFGRYRVP